MTSTQPVIPSTPVSASAQDKPLDNAASDPAKWGWMQGFPPPADKVITFGDHLRFPQVRWTVAHHRELLPTADISRGHGPVTPLPVELRNDLDDVTFIPMGGDKPMTWAQSLDANYTDAIIVLHKGRIVYQRYFGIMTPDQPHSMWSGTKSYIGLLGAVLIAEGKLDENAKVATIIPELKDTGYSDATVRQVADQTTNLAYTENEPGHAIGAPENVDFTRYTMASGAAPRTADYDGPTNIVDFLKSIKKAGPHGENFRYRSINTDVLGWLIEKVTGKPMQQVLSERIWQQLGVENNAYVLVDERGTALAAAGLVCTLPDQARFGEMVRLGGRFNGKQIIPEAAIADIRKGGKPEDFVGSGYVLPEGYSYRDMWWISGNANGVFMTRGIMGQSVYVDPTAEMVIVRFSSTPVWSNNFSDPTTIPAFQAVADHLMTAK